MSDSAEKNCVETHELLETVGGHHPASACVTVAAPVECIPIKLEAKYSPSGIENPDSFRNHFFSNAISGNDRNMKGLHLLHPSRNLFCFNSAVAIEELLRATQWCFVQFLQ